MYRGRDPGSTITVSVLIIILTGFYFYSHNILSNLILHSIISFEFYKAESLNIYTFIGLVIMAMHLAVILFIANRLLALCKLRCRFSKLMLLFLCISSAMFYVQYILNFEVDYESHLAYIVMFITLAIMHYRRIPLGNYTAMTLMVILFSAYSVYIINHYGNKKNGNNMVVVAENLAAQHDPVAEYLLEDISDRLSRDETLNKYTNSPFPIVL
jgi:hypothetical protein